MLLGLGYNPKEIPPFSEGVTIELYEDQQGKFINVLYRGQSINKHISNNALPIPIEDFILILQKEQFSSNEEFNQFSGKTDFNFERDYINATEYLETEMKTKL